jgi:hypothetical protein
MPAAQVTGLVSLRPLPSRYWRVPANRSAP